MNSTDKVELQVSESTDGSATVVLPQSEMPQTVPEGRDDRSDPSDDADDDHDGGQDNTPDPDPAREAIRVARREERNLKKKLQKARISESNQLINTLKRQNDQMAERLAVLVRPVAQLYQLAVGSVVKWGWWR
jgi:hypothetical protein